MNTDAVFDGPAGSVVGATLVVARHGDMPLRGEGCRAGDHKGRPYYPRLSS